MRRPLNIAIGVAIGGLAYQVWRHGMLPAPEFAIDFAERFLGAFVAVAAMEWWSKRRRTAG